MSRQTTYRMASVALIALLVGLAFVMGVSASRRGPSGAEVVSPGLTATGSSTPCPLATPEWLRVDPLTSPTGAFTQTVNVTMGNTEAITITMESGAFSAPRDGPIEVSLLPNTTHNLRVIGRVRRVGSPPGCVYGGYALETVVDRNGRPLIIVQRSDGGPPDLYMPVIDAASTTTLLPAHTGPPAEAPTPTAGEVRP